MRIAGCVPAYNNESTIAKAVESLKEQTIPLTDIFVVDDGSTDATAQRGKEAGAGVVTLGVNQGRGAARARAILETHADFLLCVDGTNTLAPDFLEECLPWFEDMRVAAVYGRITQSSPKTAADRWRGRHLFRKQEPACGENVGDLITGGLVQRVAHFKAVGNYNPDCRHSEDAEMGQRLIRHGYKTIYEPKAVLNTLTSNSLRQVFERYWRWNQGREDKLEVHQWLRFHWYVLRVMVAKDLHSGDFACAGISALLPYYCAWRTLQNK